LMRETLVGAEGVEPTSLLLVGTMVFVFIEVVCSTRLREPALGVMGAAVCGRYKPLKKVISQHGGLRSRERGESNSVVAAFICAWDVLGAALSVQRPFRSDDWLPEGSLGPHVSIAIADVRRRAVVVHRGQVVDRCCRSPAVVVHRGQVVLSQTSRDLVIVRLAEHAEVIGFEVHRVRDLGVPGHVLRLVHLDLAGEFSRWVR